MIASGHRSGQPEALLAHDDFGRMLDSDGTVLPRLHEWGAHEHPTLMSPDRGNTRTKEFWLPDPDGYYVPISAL